MKPRISEQITALKQSTPKPGPYFEGYTKQRNMCINSLTYHYNDVIMGATASQITSLTIVYSTVYSDTNQRKHQSSASLAFVRGIHRRPVNSPHKWPVRRKMFSFDDVIMYMDNITGLSLVQVMGCRILCTRSSSEQRMPNFQLDPWDT